MATIAEPFSVNGFIPIDGGRSASGFQGNANDCVTRSIAIATGKPYLDVYQELTERSRWYAETHRDHVARDIRNRNRFTPRDGVAKEIYRPYLEDQLGWSWNPTMMIGSGCLVHLTPDELPEGRLVVRVSRHLTCMIDGIIYDTHDPRRNGSRCVYGFWKEED